MSLDSLRRAVLAVAMSWQHVLPADISISVFDDEERLLNGIWMGLLGLESAMVVGVVLVSLFRAIYPRLKHRAG